MVAKALAIPAKVPAMGRRRRYPCRWFGRLQRGVAPQILTLQSNECN